MSAMRPLALLLSLISLSLAADLSYQVRFVGVEEQQLLELLEGASQLKTLTNYTPSSLQALRYRAESELPELVKLLRAYGYYEGRAAARVQALEDSEQHKAEVLFSIEPGPLYRFAPLRVEGAISETLLYQVIAQAGIQEGAPALVETVQLAELKSVAALSYLGYPLARIDKEGFIADYREKRLEVLFHMDSGPACTFGPLSMEGLTEVKPRYVEERIDWKEGQLYNARAIQSTQEQLMESGLFSTVLVTHQAAPAREGGLALKMELAETKHNRLSLGATYQTALGPGGTIGWENRNIQGMGQILSLQGDYSVESHSGTLAYLYPGALRGDIDYGAEMKAAHLEIEPFHDRSYSMTQRAEIRFHRNFRMSVGLEGERLLVTHSVQNGNFWLVESPLFLEWSTANSLLNPTSGNRIQFYTTPTWNVEMGQPLYLPAKMAYSFYLPFDPSHKVVLAQKVTFGILLSRELSEVPVPKRFFGGSEEDMRGYQYYTVSPLIHGKPEGGRSLIFYSLEMRLRLSETVGLVPFFDLGNVFLTQLPNFQGKWLKSAGLGLRYFSLIGPIRLDVGFPLNPRPGLDKFARALISIGQAF